MQSHFASERKSPYQDLEQIRDIIVQEEAGFTSHLLTKLVRKFARGFWIAVMPDGEGTSTNLFGLGNICNSSEAYAWRALALEFMV